MSERNRESDGMSKLLRVENLSKDRILDRVSFEMDQGEMLAVMGPSGSGKSTLLYNVAGMDRPSGGKIWIHGRETAGLGEDTAASYGVCISADEYDGEPEYFRQYFAAGNTGE